MLEGNRSGRDSLGVVCLLLEHGADANAQDWNIETPLHLASKHRKLAIGCVLFIHGPYANAENSRGQTPLHSLWPWRNGDGFLFARILVDGGADVDARDKDQETPLHMAYRKNRPDIAQCLLMRGADRDAKNNKGETPSQLAPRLTATAIHPTPHISARVLGRATADNILGGI
ncbi:ankyrin repeat protein [Lactarius vividus]|nr:ankyrin repeat protein [Lactarius vividus]